MDPVLLQVRYVTLGKVFSKFVNGGVLGVTLSGFKPEQLVEEVSCLRFNRWAIHTRPILMLAVPVLLSLTIC